MRDRRTVGPSRRPSWIRPDVPLAAIPAVAAVLAFAAWEGTVNRGATAAHVSVLVTIALAFACAFAAGRRRQCKSSAAWARDGLRTIARDVTGRADRRPAFVAGVALWSVLVLAAIGWDLYSFSEEVHSLPTLSRLFGDVTGHEWGRALVFAAWLLLGACLSIGWRRRSSGVP
ncbi:MAG: hypothetical protein ACRDWE_01120 [Acidimicrobiales bacterium]